MPRSFCVHFFVDKVIWWAYGRCNIRFNLTRTLSKSDVMKRAWEIRRIAASNIGCKVSEVSMSECMKIAWEEEREGRNLYRFIPEYERKVIEFPKRRREVEECDGGYQTCRM